jgi:hypothetical protein
MAGQFRTTRTFDAVFLIVIAAALLWSTVHRVEIGDWIFFINFHPSAETTQIASDAGLSPEGRRLFYRTNPVFTTRADVTAHCDIESLGCITTGGQVFILDDPGNHTQTVVVAAHEMLHLAYRRLSPQQKDDLEPLLSEGISRNAILGIGDELAQEDTPDGRLDEAHSRLGTEYKDIPPALESYYRTYFTNRNKVLADASAH